MANPTTNLGLTKPLSEQDAQKIATLNVEADELDTAIAGYLPLDVAGSANVTLTRDQALNKFLKFTGVLTGSIYVSIPATLGFNREYIVWNATTGAFTLGVKIGSGTQVNITQGRAVILFHDGTTVYVSPEFTPGTGSVGVSSLPAAIGARVYHNAAQAVTTSILTTLAFNSERWDTDTIHDTATNNSRLTCKTAGKYSIFFTLEWASNAVGSRQALIQLNGGSYIAIASWPAINGESTKMTGGTVYDLAVNDYVELVGWQTSGGNLNVNSAAAYTPEFGMVRIGS